MQKSKVKNLKTPSALFEKFHDKTKYKGKTILLSAEKEISNFSQYKEYPRLEKVILPTPLAGDKVKLQHILTKRLSSRNFSKKLISLEILSTLLYYSSGIKKTTSPIANRFYPSAGSRYPLEIYILSQNGEIPKGVYHYNVKNHYLEVLVELDTFDYTKYFNQKWIVHASYILLFTGVFSRTVSKYGSRGYRHILQEAGHLGQNFYLNAAALDIRICAVGLYKEQALEKLIDIDGKNESVIYCLCIGNKK